MSKRRDKLATMAISQGWRLAWANTPYVGTVNKFTIECWFKGARVMLVQAWHDGVTTYFQGGGETWEQLEAELARDNGLPQEPSHDTSVDVEDVMRLLKCDMTSAVSFLSDKINQDSLKGAMYSAACNWIEGRGMQLGILPPPSDE